MNSTEIQNLFKNYSALHPYADCKLVETHISWVILGEDEAFKLKKPLQFSFLDFTTFEKRKQACEKELALNRRLAPEIYQDVIAVYSHNNEFHFSAPSGPAIEYAVKMRRLPTDRQMDLLMKKGEVNAGHVVRLARILAKFHLNAKPVKIPNRMREEFNDLLSVKQWVSEHLGEERSKFIHNICEFSNEFLTAKELEFQFRNEEGLNRDLHGDLHSGNIFLGEDPVIFDCIEFNDEFRQIDVLNECAFFCMDLETYGKEELSRVFMENYIQLSGFDFGKNEQELFVYFKMYRANVRAKVAAIRGMQAGKDSTTHAADCAKYLGMMDSYLKDLNTFR